MEQQIQPKSQQPIIIQNNKKKIIVTVIISVLITAFVVGVGVYFFIKKEVDKVVKQQNTQNLNDPTLNPTNNNVVADGINLKDYSVVSYPFIQSPVYKQLSKKCLDGFNNLYTLRDLKDARLVKNGTEIVIPSLKLFILNADSAQKQTDNWDDCYSWNWDVDIFSTPTNGKYLYLKTINFYYSDAPYSGLSEIYRLDLSNLSIKRLSVSDFLRNVDLYRGTASDSYEILDDGKRVVKWNMNGVYIVNLETDSKSNLYIAPENQWLISNIEFAMGQIAHYDVKINGNQVVIGLYDKTVTQEGYPIKIDKYGNVNVESNTFDFNREVYDIREIYDIKPKFIKKVSVTIPN
ncbi:MAG: hypothetical protein ACPL3E_02955 [Minisyncoccia bacterium]